MKLILSRWWVLLGLGVVVAVMATFLIACTDNQPGGARATASAATGSAVTNSECPVSGKPINRDVFLDHEGRRIYFCCQMCPNKFKADPARYLAVLDGEQAAPQSEMQCGAAGSGSSSPMQCGSAQSPAAGDPHSAHSSHGSAASASATAVKYTCPMHPEIVTDAPGRCPKCGMNLVPKQ